MERRMPWRRYHADTSCNLLLAADELEFVRVDNGHEVPLEIARRCALVRVHWLIVLAPLHHVARLRKRQPDLPAFVAIGVAARVIEMEMGIDHDRYVIRRHSDLAKCILQ